MLNGCVLAGLLLVALPSYAGCKLPIPDGGDEGYMPSKANLFGEITQVDLPTVTIRDGRAGSLAKVSLTEIRAIYSVYGGDWPLTDLKPKLQVWVWFEGCKHPKGGVPKAAYFQVFSTNPQDRAKLDWDGRIVSTPR